jgi:ATP-dependent Clp protease adapter protein ClpS
MFEDLANQLWPAITRPTASVEVADPTELLSYDYETLEEVLSRVVLYNDDHHTFDEVILQVSKAIACSEFEAEAIAWEVHLRGQAVVFEGDLFKCLRVSSVLEEIALYTQVLT